MKRCARCILPETFPAVEFDAEGVCRYCRTSKSPERLGSSKDKYRKRFEELRAQRKKPGGYDGIMAYSGGKDSTYTLAVLRKEYDLSLLAVTMDNGFISPKALQNCRRVVEGLGVDYLVYKPRFDILSKLFLQAAKSDFYASKKGLERASTICTTCMGVIKGILLRKAIESGIPFVFYGWSPGQAPVESSIFGNNPQMVKRMQDALLEPMRKIAGDEVENYFLRDEHFSLKERFPYNVSPLAFLDYDEDRVLERVSALGWERPDDTDPNSTNCLLNALGIKVHVERLGFHPYAFELAGLVRKGHMEREEAVRRLEEEPSPEMVSMVRERLEEFAQEGGPA